MSRTFIVTVEGADEVAQSDLLDWLSSQVCVLIRSDVLARGSIAPSDNLVLVLGVDEVDKVLIMDGADVRARQTNLTPLIRSLGGSLCG